MTKREDAEIRNLTLRLDNAEDAIWVLLALVIESNAFCSRTTAMAAVATAMASIGNGAITGDSLIKVHDVAMNLARQHVMEGGY